MKVCLQARIIVLKKAKLVQKDNESILMIMLLRIDGLYLYFNKKTSKRFQKMLKSGEALKVFDTNLYIHVLG